jgi:hypothetical protein
MPTYWRQRSDAARIAATIRDEAERVGLAPSDAVLDAIDVTPGLAPSLFSSLPDSMLAEIRSGVRAFALDHPEHVRDPAAIKLSPREAWEHALKLRSEGRRAEADAFQLRNADAIEAARRVVAREAQAAQIAEHRRTLQANALRDKLARARWSLQDAEKLHALVTKDGVVPGGTFSGGRAATPRDVRDAEERLALARTEVAHLDSEWNVLTTRS